MAFKKIKHNIRHKRLGQWLRVNFRFTKRKIRRFFHSESFRNTVKGKYAKNMYIALVGGILALTCIISAHLAATRLLNMEQTILDKLTYGEDFDRNIPYFRTLHAIGSSNHLCVTLKTAAIDNLKDPTVALENGGISLKMGFDDGTTQELALTRKYRKDCFAQGQESYFFVTLPFGYTPFDITSTALTLTPGADGTYDDWLCERATVSFMLEGQRVLISQNSWKEPKRFGNGGDTVRSADLDDKRTDNTSYNQMSLLFEKLNTLAIHGLTDFADASLKNDTLASLALSNAGALYLDVETVSSSRNAEIKGALGENSALPQNEDLNYNGMLQVEVTFNGQLADGTHSKIYLLDTPGKDDFELAGASTFRMDMPEGMCVFDITKVTVTLSDISDAWSPRFARLYLTLDFDKELELARITDSYLEQQYDTSVFYHGFLDSPVAFDLKSLNSIPENEADDIKETYQQELSQAAHSMYFEKQSFYSRQIRFYEQMDKLFAPGEVIQ